jgi:hypothetical protein
MAEHDTLLNAVIGAAVTALVSSIVPVAPFFGGALAGYLEGGTRSDGLRVGAISGVIGAVFLGFVLAAFAFVATLFLAGTSGSLSAGAVGLLFFAVVAVVAGLIVVGLSAVGGWVGNYLKYETDGSL